MSVPSQTSEWSHICVCQEYRFLLIFRMHFGIASTVLVVLFHIFTTSLFSWQYIWRRDFLWNSTLIPVKIWETYNEALNIIYHQLDVQLHYAINTYHHWSCEFESSSWWCVVDVTLCDKNLSVTCNMMLIFSGYSE